MGIWRLTMRFAMQSEIILQGGFTNKEDSLGRGIQSAKPQCHWELNPRRVFLPKRQTNWKFQWVLIVFTFSLNLIGWQVQARTAWIHFQFKCKSTTNIFTKRVFWTYESKKHSNLVYLETVYSRRLSRSMSRYQKG